MRLTYQYRWLPADLLFIIDTISGNPAMAEQYHEVIKALGLNPTVTNTLVSVGELLRIFILIAQRHV